MGPQETDTTVPPVEPEQQPMSEAEVPAQPVQTETPQPQGVFPNQTAPAPQLPVKKSKKGLIIGLIAGGAVLLALVISGLVYALVYNNPENAVVDAFTKAISAKSGSATGTASIKSDSTTFKVDFSSATNESGQSAGDATVTITADGKDYTLKGHYAGTKDEVYVKVDDVKSVLEGILGSEYSDMIDMYYGSLLDKVDGKWVVIKQSDLEELSSGSVDSKESQCIQTEIGKLQSDASVRNEVMDVYKKHPLFTIESKGSDSDGNHYTLTPVENDKAKEFANTLVETTFFKALDDCTSTDLKSEFTNSSDSSSSSSTATGSLDVWVDGWSHTLNKVTLSVKDDDNKTEVTLDVNTKFNNNPAVTIPTGATTVDDLKSEIEKIQQEMMSSYMYDYSAYDTSYDTYDYSF